MDEFIALLLIAFTSLASYLLIRRLNLLSKDESLLAFASSYGLGTGLMAFQLYFYSRLNIGWSRESLILPWIIIVAITLLFRSGRKIRISPVRFPSLSKIEKILISGIIFSIGYVIFEALIRPPVTWDAWAIWLSKSKIFFIDGRIDPQALNYIKSDYPLNFSLLGTFLYICLGRINDSAVLLFSVFFYIFLGFAIFASLKKKFGFSYALIFTFLYSTTQNFIRHGGRLEAGMADLPVGYFTFIATVLLIEYIKTKRYTILVLLCTFLGFLGSIKFEGVVLSILISLLLIFHIFKSKKINHSIVLFLWAAPIVEWQIFKKAENLRYDYFSSHLFYLSGIKTWNAFTGTVKEFINIKSWNMLWLIYFLILFASTRYKNLESFVLSFIIIGQLSIYLLLYIFTLGNDPHSSFQRLLIHLAPLAIYYVALQVKVILSKKTSALWLQLVQRNLKV